jgi:hypothetical protein
MNFSLSLNLQKHFQSVKIPTDWSVPKFSFGQVVRWEIPDSRLEVKIAWGQIVGLSFWNNTWFYDVLPSLDCPIAIAYPTTWGTGNDWETLPAERLTLMTEEVIAAQIKVFSHIGYVK